MFRLTGLPNVVRFPKATVRRRDDRFELLFHGGEHTTRIDVAFRHLGDIDDLELAELDLLAQLQRLGYEVDRLQPVDEPGR
ncbi:MAG TPA: hypothetical protein VE570_04415 [Thermoleophilaceae bacterium]|jgi:hypothetical protein|nr:hypothetical protein [Thermoleophilaceae bacterium]